MKAYTRPSDISQSMRRDDTKNMLRYWRKSFTIVSIIVAFLLFFLNILIGIANHTQQFSYTLQDKLGMYFYIQDEPEQEEAIYTKVVQLQKELEYADIDTTFVSKKDAMGFLQQKIPDVLSKFKDYGIGNPFPATLYVKVRNEADYTSIQEILPNYAEIISNSEDIQQSRTIEGQEKRLIKAISFSSFLTKGSYFLVGVFILIIMTVLLFLLKLQAQKFYKKIELKKLLGASYSQIRQPFVVMAGSILLIGFILMLGLVFGLDNYLKYHDFSLMFFVDVFSLDILPESLLNFITGGGWIILGEFIILAALIYLVSRSYLSNVIRKAGN